MEPAATQAGHAIRNRRQHLGLKQAEAADLAGVSRATWVRAEQGDKPLTGATVAAVMSALGWTRASYTQLLAGEAPTEAGAEFDARIDSLETRLTALTERLDQQADLLEDFRATLRTLLKLSD